ncbi:hypothetical protein [Spirosoma gilvum]
MEPFSVSNLASIAPESGTARVPRRKVNGEATAALLIKMASELLAASPTLRKRINVNLSDLAAAEKVRRELARKSTGTH